MKRKLETPEILAQAECKDAVMKAANKMLDFYEELTEKGLIKGVSYEFVVYNSGYEFIVKPTFEWSNLVNLPDGLQAFICQSQRISLQPESFFNDNYANGEAHFEQYTNIGNKPESKTLPIRRAGDSFVLYVEDRISELKNMIK